METFIANPLNFLIFFPLLSAVIVAMLPGGYDNLARYLALGLTIPTLFSAIAVFYTVHNTDPAASGYWFEYSAAWFPQLGSNWHLGVDGISVTMILLTGILAPLSILIAFEHEKNPRAILALILGLQAAMMGVFAALDMMVFFIFYEIGLVPMYFIINQWGGKNRRYASNKFFIYTMAGSLGLLLAMQLVAFSVGDAVNNGVPTFDVPVWTEVWPNIGYDAATGGGELLGFNAQGVKYLAFLGFFLAFALKIPVFPFHTWLPDAHTEAPTAGSMLLAGVLLKQGAYGFIRFVIPLFPDVIAREIIPTVPFTNIQLEFLPLQFAEIIAFLAMLGIVLGALAAWAQDDFKKLVAYSSVNHMGFVVLGLAVMAVVYSTLWAQSVGRYDLAVEIAGEKLVDEDIERYGAQANLTPGTTLVNLTQDQRETLAEFKFEALVEPRLMEERDNMNPTGSMQDATTALNGAVLQMFNHGLSAAGMFLLVGGLYHKAHTRDLRRFGGLWHIIPFYGGLLVFVSMASLGLPGLNGFTGEFLIVAGSFRIFPVMVLLSMIGLLFTGAYILKGLQNVLHGPTNEEWREYHENEHSLEIERREVIALAPLVVLMLITGLYPNWILPVIDGTVSDLFMAFGIG
jgi:proton-translocating NADH-quinone oxidoreductase chain M